MQWYLTDGYEPIALTAKDQDEDYIAYRPTHTSIETLGAPVPHLNTTRPVIGERASAARAEFN